MKVDLPLYKEAKYNHHLLPFSKFVVSKLLHFTNHPQILITIHGALKWSPISKVNNFVDNLGSSLFA